MPGLAQAIRFTLERHRQLPFLRATMAACALVAIADGSVRLSERIRIDRILETLDGLQVFDPHEGVDLFNGFVEGILRHPEAGRKQALKAVISSAGDPDTARLLVRVCIAVSRAAGEEISLPEKIEIVSLCSRLGVDPGGAGLDSTGIV